LNTAVEEGLKPLLEIDGLSVHHLCGPADFAQLHAMSGALPPAVRDRYTLEPFSASMFELLSSADLSCRGRVGESGS